MLSTILKKSNDIWENTGHLKEKEFEKLLRKCKYTQSTIGNQIYVYRNFKEKYVNLSDWFEEDIFIRVSDVKDRDVNYRSRIYLFLMSIMGLKLDYGFLCSISGTDGYVRLLSYLNIDIGFEDLRAKSIELGYSEFIAGTSLKWALVRILMHTGKLHYSEITLEDIYEFRDYALIYEKVGFKEKSMVKKVHKML